MLEYLADHALVENVLKVKTASSIHTNFLSRSLARFTAWIFSLPGLMPRAWLLKARRPVTPPNCWFLMPWLFAGKAAPRRLRKLIGRPWLAVMLSCGPMQTFPALIA